MIHHNRQAIFTHIARTGGSSIETAFYGTDYWLINSNEKHIPAAVARKLYEPYWKSYYKFSIVRNPFDRFRSLWKYSGHYGLYLNDNGEIELDKYLKFWGYPYVVEVNSYVNVDVTEFYRTSLRLRDGALYGNLLRDDVEVFKFEDFPKIWSVLGEKTGINTVNAPFTEKSMEAKPPLSDKAMEIIREIHDKDFDTFGYSRDYTNK